MVQQEINMGNPLLLSKLPNQVMKCPTPILVQTAFYLRSLRLEQLAKLLTLL
jgi:hypothetical protein